MNIKCRDAVKRLHFKSCFDSVADFSDTVTRAGTTEERACSLVDCSTSDAGLVSGFHNSDAGFFL